MRHLGGPFNVLWSVPPWWLEDYPLIMEPPVGLSGRERGPSLSEETVMAPVWQGPTPLVLGPGSWGFGIGAFPGTAIAPPPDWPERAPVYTKPGPYGL